MRSRLAAPAMLPLLLALAAAGLAAEPAPAGEAAAEKPLLSCSIDFEGGSAEVESIDQQGRTIRLRPSDHPDRGWRCWWYFKLSGIEPGETITIDVGDAPWATPDQATFSLDDRTWQHTAPGRRDGKRIVYQQRIDAAEAWFAWGPPFVPRDAAALVERAARRCRYAESFTLCETRGGRPTPALRVSQPGAGDAERYGVWIIARQHAWESGASWVCRGLIEWLISDDPRAESLRKRSLVTLVPIMDIDNTAIGAGGKQQKPQDHNRDWSDQPHWRSVAAVQDGIRRADEAGRFDLFLDLHNPGANDKEPFFYTSPRDQMSPLGERNLDRFLEVAAAEITGPLRPTGKTRVSGPDYDKQWRQISKNWVTEHTRPHVAALTLETSWNTPQSTCDGYLTIGRQLGMAIERYLRANPREPPQ